MKAVYITRFDADDPAAVVQFGERPAPEPRDGWTTIEVRAASLNHHDVWSARGVALKSDRLPMILGGDAAGVDGDGNEVILHSVITDPSWRGPEMLDPSLSLLSERHQGTFAQRVAVPEANVLPKPPELSFEQACCLPTAWLTAYRMLFTQAALRPGDTVLVQGSSGGLSSGLIVLGNAAGLRVWVTGRSEDKRAFALEQGAEQAFEPGVRLPERVDAVMDSVGAGTWKHSLASLRRGGAMVVSGGTSGYTAQADVARIFALNLRILGSTMGTREELARLVAFVVKTGLRPMIEAVTPLGQARTAFAKLATGDVRGKLVLTP
ncbi:MAG: zinc-binding dehydrogenase [Solirubrobacteraceae bacterium]